MNKIVVDFIGGFMYNINLYDELGEEYDSDRKFLNNKFNMEMTTQEINSIRQKINFEINSFRDFDNGNINHIILDKSSKRYRLKNRDINKSIDDIDRVYSYCHKNAFKYSWYNITKNHFASKLDIKEEFKLYDMKLNDKLDSFEVLIKEHCIVVSLYTVQCLLNKDKQLSAKELSGIGRMGHNYLIDKRFPPQEDKRIYEKICSVHKKVEQLKELEQLSKSYLGQAFNEITKDNYRDKNNKKTKSTSLFLSNYICAIIDIYDKFFIYDLINGIRQEEVQKERNKKIKKFIFHYIDYCAYFTCYNEASTEVDKILFYYQKENTFNFQLISSLFIKESDSSDSKKKKEIILDENTDIDLIKECMMLPNEFSKADFVRLFDEEFKRYFDNPKEMIKLLKEFIFPIFEKLFFINLYEFIKQDENSNLKSEEILEIMNLKLTEHFEKNKVRGINASITNQIQSEDIGIFIKNVHREKSYNKLSDIYDLIEYYFINSIQKRPRIKGLNYKKVETDLEEQEKNITMKFYNTD